LTFVALALLQIVSIWYMWIGFLGSDDVAWYYRGARGWLDHPPFIGGHGTIRYLLTLPIAASISILGDTQFALLLPSLIYGIAATVFVMVWSFRHCSCSQAFMGTAALMTIPVVAQHMSVSNIDLVEAFFVFAGLVLYLEAIERGATFSRLFIAGVCLGAAFLCRETSAFVPVAFVLLFLCGFGMSRKWYFVLGAGFIAINFLQSLYLGVMTGDPLYRYHIIEGADPYLDRSVNLEGNVRIHPLIDSLLVMLLNQEYALLFWLACPAVYGLLRRAKVQGAQRNAVVLFALVAFCWVVGVAAMPKALVLNTRYFIMPAMLLALPIGWFVAWLWERKKHMWAGALGLILFGGNFVAMAVDNKDFMFGELELVRVSRAHPGETIYTDEQSYNRSYMLLKWAGVLSRVRPSHPISGKMFLENRARAEEYPSDMIAICFKAREKWQKLAEAKPARRFPFNLIDAIGGDRLLPAGLRTRLMERHPGTILYRVTNLAEPGCDLGRRYVKTADGFVRAPIRNVMRKARSSE
jgi:hypothetical protein